VSGAFAAESGRLAPGELTPVVEVAEEVLSISPRSRQEGERSNGTTTFCGVIGGETALGVFSSWSWE
jgi:hypothetical protein